MYLYSGKFSPGKFFRQSQQCSIAGKLCQIYFRAHLIGRKLNSTKYVYKWRLVRGCCLQTYDARTVRDLSMSTTQFYQGRLTAALRLCSLCLSRDMSTNYGRHDQAMHIASECECECEHQGALRDAYNVAKPRLTVLDNLFMHS